VGLWLRPTIRLIQSFLKDFAKSQQPIAGSYPIMLVRSG
jgi:hypothetical protein